MTNVYSFDGILVFGLLFICTCAYLKKVPRLNSWLLSEKKGVWGVFYKGPVHTNLLFTHPHGVPKPYDHIIFFNGTQGGISAAVIGTRLHIAVAALCLCMAFYLIFLK